mgnify:CR=1 FL=1
MQYTNILKTTLTWYDENKRELPWRKFKDPYKIWLSEIMLQQTRVNTVIPYYKRWLNQFKSLEDVAETDLDTLLKSWEGLGYYSRCRNFHNSSKIIVEKYNGKIPDTYDEFILLPGVGSYIASAVLSISHKIKLPAIDVNLKRVYARLLKIKKYTKHNLNRIEKFAFELVQCDRPGDINQAIMDIGSQICHLNNPLCEICPIKNFCKAYASGNPNMYALKYKNKKIPTRKMISGLIMVKNKFLIIKRKNETFLGGLWELPTIEISSNKKDLIKDSFINKFHQKIDLINKIGSVEHSYSHFKVNVDLYLCVTSKKIKITNESKWININEFNNYAFSKVNHKLMEIINSV